LRGSPTGARARARAPTCRRTDRSRPSCHRHRGLIERRVDPADGRRALVELTTRGRETLGEDRRHREGWLARAIAEDLTACEQRLLAEALPLLERLAED
jgi:DNA-binding PadR family transcriptional regulator